MPKKFGHDTEMARKERYHDFYRAIPKALVNKFRHSVSPDFLNIMRERGFYAANAWWQDDDFIPVAGSGFVVIQGNRIGVQIFLPLEDSDALQFGLRIIDTEG